MGARQSRPPSAASPDSVKSPKRRRRCRLGRRISHLFRRRRKEEEEEEPEQKPSNLDVAKGLNEPDPSLLAAGVAIEWKLTSGQSETSLPSVAEKNCNVLQDQRKPTKELSPVDRRPSAEELTQEFLMQIIRCFPFPSPKPSPRNSPKCSPTTARRRQSCHPAFRLHPETSSDVQEPKQRFLSVKKNSNNRARLSPNSSMETIKHMVVNSVDTMAVTALPLDCWLRERLKQWCQLSGHEGTIVPATDDTLWKRRSGTDFNEATAYRRLMDDVLCPFVPVFKKEVEYKGESFIEIEDLTSRFENPAIMDVKLGTRTFLESEVTNPVKRSDLYQKMIKIDPTEPTEEEHEAQALTKLRYMQFRERESSTASLGFRIEAIKLPGRALDRSFQKVKTREQVMEVLCKFMGGSSGRLRLPLLERLKAIREKVEQSQFFRNHEVIGSSLLLLYDAEKSGVWLIDFAKALPIDVCVVPDHRRHWELGNHEDGYLSGLDNLIQIWEDSRHKELTGHEGLAASLR